jgi:hypothetical protein
MISTDGTLNMNDIKTNWFERHLNWTALCIGAGSFFLCILLVGVIWHFRLTFYPSLLGFPISFFTWLVIACYFTLSALGLHWVILQKKCRSFPTYMFLLAVLVSLAISVISNFFVPIAIILEYSLLFYTIILLIPCMFYIIASKKRVITQKIDDLMQHKMSAQKKGLMNRTISWGRLRRTIIILIAAAILFTVSSVLYTHYGYKTFVYTWHRVPSFSFLHPPDFHEPYMVCTEYAYNEEEDILLMKSPSILHSDDPWINLNVYTKEFTGEFGYVLDDYKHFVVGTRKSWFTTYGKKGIIIQNYSETPVTINGLPAYLISFTVPEDENPYHRWGSYACAYFLYNDMLWTIEFMHEDRVFNDIPTYFTHLIESFKFLDE